MSNPDMPQPDGDLVSISTPADATYVSTLRLAAASLGSRCGLTIDDIEDLRLAVDEACSLLLPHASATSELEARFELSPNQLIVSASITTDEAREPDRDGIGWTVLEALSTSVDVHKHDARLTISVCKARETVQT